MTTLLTIDDLVTRVGLDELTQLAGIGSHNTEDGRSLDEPRIVEAIGFADDMIKSYVAKRYPLIHKLEGDQVPDLLKGFASDIARYRLRSRSGSRNTVSDEVETRYKDAMVWLKDVSRGQVNVDFSDAEGGQQATDDASATPAGLVRANIPDGRAATALNGYLT